MISFGAILGKASRSQVIVFLLLEMFIYAINAEYFVGTLFGELSAQVCSVQLQCLFMLLLSDHTCLEQLAARVIVLSEQLPGLCDSGVLLRTLHRT